MFFGLPLLAVGILWSEELLGFFDQLVPVMVFVSLFAILRALSVSPDSTGGLKCELSAMEGK